MQAEAAAAAAAAEGCQVGKLEVGITMLVMMSDNADAALRLHFQWESWTHLAAIKFRNEIKPHNCEGNGRFTLFIKPLFH